MSDGIYGRTNILQTECKCAVNNLGSVDGAQPIDCWVIYGRSIRLAFIPSYMQKYRSQYLWMKWNIYRLYQPIFQNIFFFFFFLNIKLLCFSFNLCSFCQCLSFPGDYDNPTVKTEWRRKTRNKTKCSPMPVYIVHNPEQTHTNAER